MSCFPVKFIFLKFVSEKHDKHVATNCDSQKLIEDLQKLLNGQSQTSNNPLISQNPGINTNSFSFDNDHSP